MPLKVPRNTPSNSLPIGMIIQARLSEVEFQAANGASWVLMDGRDVTGSVYATITGQTTLEDARGLVIRGKNNGRTDGNENPGGDLNLGVFQDDAMQQITGHWGEAAGQGVWTSGGITAVGAAGITNHGSNNPGGGGAAAKRLTFDSANSPGAKTATENRMRNITLNTFIKINP